MWMTDQSNKSSQKTSATTTSVISLPESEAGAMPCGSPTGPMTDSSGLGRAPANRSRQQAKEKVSQTPDTYGLSGSGSSESVALSQSLANKLTKHLVGSTLFRETWKVKTTPLGRQLWAHTASVPRISDRDCTGWPSPRGPHGSGPSDAVTRGLTPEGAAKLAAWPTPQNHDDRKRGNTKADHHHFPHDLPNMAEMASQHIWGAYE